MVGIQTPHNEMFAAVFVCSSIWMICSCMIFHFFSFLTIDDVSLCERTSLLSQCGAHEKSVIAIKRQQKKISLAEWHILQKHCKCLY